VGMNATRPGPDLVNAGKNAGGQHRVLTIVVDLPTRTIWQVRGKCIGCRAGELAMDRALKRWLRG
jgi:hypothetical protein